MCKAPIDTTILLEKFCRVAERFVAKGYDLSRLYGESEWIRWLETIVEHAEKKKGVLTVLLTSIVYKIIDPKQDIRYHQASLPGGYSGRTFDTKYVTPFLKAKKFPCMAESGWLTRSLEQKSPYTLDYKGSIQPKELKESFLNMINLVQRGAISNRKILFCLLVLLIKKRDEGKIDLAKPANLTIETIISHLSKHFFTKYHSSGAARLPTLAIYAIYECLLTESKRFEGKALLPIESHTASDVQTGRIGDIQVNDEKNMAFEAVEVKHDIKITTQMVKDAFEKFSSTPVKRYYILSTANINEDENEEINNLIQSILKSHGCQVIANGIIWSLKYYLRLLKEPTEFVRNYVALVEKDQALKYEHKKMWNEIVTALGE